jgi:hypothetical protein
MLLYAVASSLRVHGESSRDGSERSLNSPENQCSIGFQPVFGSHRQVMFSSIHRSSGLRIKAQGFTWELSIKRFALNGREERAIEPYYN